MQRLKLAVLSLLLVTIALYFWHMNNSGAQDEAQPNLQFAIEGGKIYFFEPKTGRIFVYQATTNRFSQLLTLEELGKDLKQSRSLSTVEREKEQ
ncbi:MAG: hypothetical protein JW714_01895 [Candidatus Omnitrophica bacterium]|nr:hypothetical protein [Candidatus Omnitrophota bacterium]